MKTNKKSNILYFGLWLSVTVAFLAGCGGSKSITKGNEALIPNIATVEKHPSNHTTVVNRPNDEIDVWELPLVIQANKKYPEAIKTARDFLVTDPMLTEKQRNVLNYNQEVRYDDNFLYIVFRAKRPSGAEGSGHTEEAKGHYIIIRKNDNFLVARKFWK